MRKPPQSSCPSVQENKGQTRKASLSPAVQEPETAGITQSPMKSMSYSTQAPRKEKEWTPRSRTSSVKIWESVSSF
ncbi:hypothetical protein ILYODFUR_030047 [Ilyodon furcidens]|uniref:Uncharacterized protein n=1 Tax=Ilyodon furcidens TaxID=33524 RepID=A0ABV0UWK9_9TELE